MRCILEHCRPVIEPQSNAIVAVIAASRQGPNRPFVGLAWTPIPGRVLPVSGGQATVGHGRAGGCRDVDKRVTGADAVLTEDGDDDTR